MSSELLEVTGLTTGYDGVPVVHDVDLVVAPGQVVALLGANGAGKTTTLMAVSALLPRLAGDIRYLGEPVDGHRRARARAAARLARSGLAHVPEDRGLFFDLTVAEHLRLGRRRGQPAMDDEEIVTRFPALRALLRRPAGLLSGGEQQMLAMARALVGRPRLLLVDEMSLGLAPIIVQQLLPALRTFADDTGAGVLVVEQHVALALSVADHAYLLQRGRIAAAGSATELAARPELVEAGYFGEPPAVS